MNHEEAKQIVMILDSAYPNSFKTDRLKYTVNVWGEMLKGYSYQDALDAVRAYISTDTKGFAPAIGQVIDIIGRTHTSLTDKLTAAEAWDLVAKGLSRIHWDEPEAEWNKLPEACRRAIGTVHSFVEIAKMDTDDVLIGEKARFMHQYDAVVKRQEEYERLPADIKAMIETKERAAIE